MSNTVVTIGAPSGQTQVSVSSADIIYIAVAAGFTGQGGGGGSGANLSTTRTATTVTVVSDSGTDATIAAADGSNAGVMTAAMKTKLDGIEAGAEVNDSASEILTKLLTVDGSGSSLDADTLDGVHASALVPYTGATGDVNLGEHGIQLGNLEFDNTPTNTPATDGSVFWDDGDGTLQLQMKGGATQKVGMNTFARVYNDSGVQLIKGDVVYISGAQGNRIAAKKAQANSETTSKGTIGFCVETIAAGAEGVVITEGPLYNLNTFGLTAGQTLYLSATTAGGYTTTAPQAPDHIVILATVERVHATAGSIYVKVDNGYELEELHDVDLTESKATPVDADAVLLQDSADSSIWKRLTWANLKATAKTYFDTLYANIVHTHIIGDVTNLQTTLDGKVDENTPITGATKTKITYDAKGLVTAGADAAIADITGLQTALDGKANSSHTHSAADITSGTLDGDRLPGLSATKRGGVPATGTPSGLFLKDDGTWATPATGGVTDGDKGDITVSSSGTVWTVDNNAITYAKIQNVSATSRLLGRASSGAGDVEEITIGSGLSLSGTTLSATGGGGSTGLTILNQDFTQKGPQNSTTETALYSYTLPTDLVAGDALRLDLSGFYKNNSGGTRSIFFYVKLGATTVFSFNPTIGVHSTERPGTMMLNIAIVATNSQKFALTGWSTDLGVVGSTPGYLTTSSASMYNFIGYNTCAEDLTSAKTLQVSVRFQLANADLYWYSQMATLTKLPKP